ncbi:MAG: hypothetical protein JK586_05730, partial [Nocardiopsis sp. BM-2018]
MLLGLGESHRFEDGFTVTMGPVERRTDPPLTDESATDAEDGAGEGTDPADELEDDGDEDLDGEDLGEDEALEEEPVEEPEEDEPAPEEDETVVEDEGDDPAEDEPVEDEPVDEPVDDPVDEGPAEEEPEDEEEDEPEDEGDDYYAWTVELSNGSDAEVHTGSIFTECSVGTPLTLSSAPLLGEALNPPMALAPDE